LSVQQEAEDQTPAHDSEFDESYVPVRCAYDVVPEELAAPEDEYLYSGPRDKSRPDLLIDEYRNIPPLYDGADVLRYSDVAAQYLFVMGRPFNLIDRPFLREIMDIDSRETHLQCGRQVGKSITMASELIIHGTGVPNYPQLYVTPRGGQASVFSRDVFNAICKDSPEIIPFVSGEATWQVNAREFTNRSRTYFRSAFHTPDAIRGITAGRIIYDERQDLVSDFVAVINECAANFPDRRTKFVGTPKSKSNMLSRDFYKSTACEWLVRCDACNHYNYQDMSIIGDTGYICQKCGKPIDVSSGCWVPANPSKVGDSNGYRITQMMNPNVSFADVKRKIEDQASTELTVHNEIFGLPYDEGALVISEEDVAQCCQGYTMAPRTGKRYPFRLFAGVDWGGGNQENQQASYTVMCIGGFRGEQFKVVHFTKFERHEADIYRQPEYINDIGRKFRIHRMVGDYGFGTINNRRLVNDYGWSPFSMMEAQATNAREYVKWIRAGRWGYNRTEACIKIIDSIKQHRIDFPRWEDMKPFVSDFTGIFVETDARGNITFDHNTPDDAFMALFYCYLAATLDLKGVSRYAIENWASGVNNPIYMQ